jgi:hypothetical protein
MKHLKRVVVGSKGLKVEALHDSVAGCNQGMPGYAPQRKAAWNFNVNWAGYAEAEMDASRRGTMGVAGCQLWRSSTRPQP